MRKVIKYELQIHAIDLNTSNASTCIYMIQAQAWIFSKDGTTHIK